MSYFCYSRNVNSPNCSSEWGQPIAVTESSTSIEETLERQPNMRSQNTMIDEEQSIGESKINEVYKQLKLKCHKFKIVKEPL